MRPILVLNHHFRHMWICLKMLLNYRFLGHPISDSQLFLALTLWLSQLPGPPAFPVSSPHGSSGRWTPPACGGGTASWSQAGCCVWSGLMRERCARPWRH